MDMLLEWVVELWQQGRVVCEGLVEYQWLKDVIVFFYDVSKFLNKWCKMWCNELVWMFMVYFGKDSYSYIYYDSEQVWMIFVREVVWLQFFLDGFVFSGIMNLVFWQIGNVVLFLMVKSLVVIIFKVLQVNQYENNNEYL